MAGDQASYPKWTDWYFHGANDPWRFGPPDFKYLAFALPGIHFVFLLRPNWQNRFPAMLPLDGSTCLDVQPQSVLPHRSERIDLRPFIFFDFLWTYSQGLLVARDLNYHFLNVWWYLLWCLTPGSPCFLGVSFGGFSHWGDHCV